MYLIWCYSIITCAEWSEMYKRKTVTQHHCNVWMLNRHVASSLTWITAAVSTTPSSSLVKQWDQLLYIYVKKKKTCNFGSFLSNLICQRDPQRPIGWNCWRLEGKMRWAVSCSVSKKMTSSSFLLVHGCCTVTINPNTFHACVFFTDFILI